METITHSRNSTTCSSIAREWWVTFVSSIDSGWCTSIFKDRHVLHVLWKSIIPLCLNINPHSYNHLIINGNSNFLLVNIWSTHRLHVTMRMIPYSMNVIQLNWLLVKVTRWVFQWMVCHCSMYHSLILSTILYPFQIPTDQWIRMDKWESYDFCNHEYSFSCMSERRKEHHDRFRTLERCFFWLLIMGRCDLAASLNALGSFRLLVLVTGGVGCGLHLFARSFQW